MSDIEKTINEYYQRMELLVYKCVLSESKEDRFRYGKELLSELERSKGNTNKTNKMVEDLIEKLTNASKIIREDVDVFNSLDIAMGEDKNQIHYIASLIRKGIENYKNKIKDEKEK